MRYQVAVLVAVMAQRIWELGLSRKRLREAEDQGASRIAEPMLVAMVAVHAAWLAGCWLEVIWLDPDFVPWIVIPMLGVWAGAILLRIWLMAALGGLWNVRLISRADQAVVADGPYRYIRHPNYLAVVLEVAAVPLLLGAYWTALIGSVANGLVLWRRIANEEAYLFTVEAYREAFAGKKRLIPGVF
jgi:methyltransferase